MWQALPISPRYFNHTIVGKIVTSASGNLTWIVKPLRAREYHVVHKESKPVADPTAGAVDWLHLIIKPGKVSSVGLVFVWPGPLLYIDKERTTIFIM